jgi:hypothetical protein
MENPMSEDVRVRGPVEVRSESVERVAFDLLEKIASYEDRAGTPPRRYFLDLYHLCWLAAHGNETEENLQDFSRR